MATLHLMHRAAPYCGWQVHAVTVDHGLRPEAADEAAFVAGFCSSLNIPHETVKWTGWDGRGNLQDRARRARYALIAGWAGRQRVSHVALGHTANDQAETFLMRLARGAGVDGLASMQESWAARGTHWWRPLIGQSREDLRIYLRQNHIDWIDDPSNEDERFDRVKARKALAVLEPLGISEKSLAVAARHLLSAKQAFDEICADFAKEHVHEAGGDLLCPRQHLAGLPVDVGRRLISGAVRWITGAEYPPRARSIGNIHRALISGQFRDCTHTLSGCRISVSRDSVRFSREARAVGGLECPTPGLWDDRWRFTGPHAPGLTVRALGAEGLTLCPDWRDAGMPRASLIASPAVWKGAELVAAPLAGLTNGWTVDPAPGRNNFASFLLSH